MRDQSCFRGRLLSFEAFLISGLPYEQILQLLNSCNS
jgi:hypothetical protein